MHVPFVDLKAQYQTIAPEIDEAIQRVLDRADFILGEEVAAFEQEFAAYLGVKNAVGVGSGLAALELALRAYGIGPGDEVITAANTYIATVLAITAVGARPVLVDGDPMSYNMDPAALEAAITSRARAVMPVHLYGRPADLDRILAIAERHHLLVIEDAAQAHGARYKGRRAGTLGHASGFSFYPGKNLGAYGDGGMVVTNDDSIAAKLRQLGNYGQQAKYDHVVRGTNTRLDTLQAGILRVKLRYLDRWNHARRNHAAAYNRLLASSGLRLPAETPEAESVYHLYVIETPGRERIQAALRAQGIDTGIHYPVPLYRQKACADLGYRAEDYPVTEAAAGRVLSLPMFPELTESQIVRVAESLGQAARGVSESMLAGPRLNRL